MLSVTWLKHACFLVENSAGGRLLMDPYAHTGYDAPRVRADVVTTSYARERHPNVVMAGGESVHIGDGGAFDVAGFEIFGVPLPHGGEHEGVMAYVVSCAGLRLCHLGGLSRRLTKEEIGLLGAIDILLTPIGEDHTLDAKTALMVAEDVGARVVIPMNFNTGACLQPLEGEQRFLSLAQRAEYTIIMHHSPVREFSVANLPRQRSVIAMDHMY